MVKAFAYGSGGAEIAGALQYQQTDYLGVAYTDEGVELRKAGIQIETKEHLSDDDKNWLKNYFLANIFPALSPIAVDPAHPFPFLPNLGLAIVLQIKLNSDDWKIVMRSNVGGI